MSPTYYVKNTLQNPQFAAMPPVAKLCWTWLLLLCSEADANGRIMSRSRHCECR